MVTYNTELNKTSVKTNRELDTKTLVRSAIVALAKYSGQVDTKDCIENLNKIHYDNKRTNRRA